MSSNLQKDLINLKKWNVPWASQQNDRRTLSATYFKYWPHSMLGPLGVFLKRIKLSERLSARLRDSLLELGLENINEELIKEGGQCAHRDTRVMRDNIS